MKKQLMMGVVVLLALGVIGQATVWAGTTGEGTPAAVPQAPPLPETFEVLGLSVSYPAGWAAREGDSGVEIANDEIYFDMMDDADEDAIPSGAFALLVLDPAMLAGLEMFTVADIMDLMVSDMDQDDEGSIGEPVETTVGEVDAVRVPVQDVESESEGYMLGFKPDDETMIIAVVVTHAGELDEFEDVALAIIESISYTPPSEMSSATTFTAHGLAIDLPEDWVGEVGDDGTITLANSEETLDAAKNDSVENIESGQVAAYLLSFNVTELGGMELLDVMDLFIGGMASSSDEFTIGEVAEETIDDFTGYAASLEQPESNMEGEIIGLDTIEGSYIIVLAVGYTGEYEDNRPLIWDMLVTLRAEED